MTDWRSIRGELFEDGFGYEIVHDPEYDASDWADMRSFKIYATAGTQRYIPVDVVIDPADTETVDALLAKAKCYLPLYLFVHSGMSVKTTPFGDPWDSGQCGFVALTEDEGFSWPDNQDTLKDMLDGMVKEFDAVLRGSVVGWRVFTKKTCESCGNLDEKHIESVWGYVVQDYGKQIDELVNDEVLPLIEYERKRLKEAEHGADTRNLT